MASAEVDCSPKTGERIENGLPNGLEYDDDSRDHSSLHADRDREKSKSSHKDKDRDKTRDREKEKDRHSSSHKSSHKDKDHRSKEKSDRERSEKHDRHKDRSEKHREDSERNHEKKDRDKEKSEKDKDRSSKERTDRDRHKEKERSDKHKHRSDKDRDREKSEKDRERGEKDRGDRNKERSEKEKARESKDKEKSEKDKEKSSREKERREKEKHKVRDAGKEEKKHSVSGEERKENHKSSYRERDMDDSPVLKVDLSPQMKEEPLDYREDHPLVITETIKEETVDESYGDDAFQEQKFSREVIVKRQLKEESDDDDDVPLIARKKIKKEAKSVPKKRQRHEEEDEDDFVKKKKPAKKAASKTKAKVKSEPSDEVTSPKKRTKKQQEEENVWKWWEEEKKEGGKKWNFLEHKGPVFAEQYTRLPSHIRFYYSGKHMTLSDETEEVAGFYAKMLDHDYTTKELFNKNFFKEWRKVMTAEEREILTDLRKCDFREMHGFYMKLAEERKNRTKEEKKALKEKNEFLVKEYGYCSIDGHKQRIGNFKIEPPGLFRGRGEHPKQGMLKRRVIPEDVIINCSKDSVVPQPPEGHKWKEVRHDNTVTWLACWVENIQGQTKYIMLNAASKLKGEKDWQKYETARKLHKKIDVIRENYRQDWKSKEMRIRQRAVALYFIDRLALRAGNEKDEDQADTVGCCSLRVEHITLHEQKDGKEYVVLFDFLGKDSIRYYNEVPVEKRVFKNLQLFMEGKSEGDDLFDRLNTQILNKHLNELMDGLTAKVFRTYNASRTLQEELEKLTDIGDNVPAKMLSYNRANREVALLCNHQRAVPKSFEKSMANLQKKIDEKNAQIDEAERELKESKRAAKHGGSVKEKMVYEKKKKAVDRLREQLHKLEISATDKEENKQIALGTSKLNYLDPRITVAWCKKYNVPVEKVFSASHRQKFRWAIDMASAEYDFLAEPTSSPIKKEEDDDEEGEEEEEYDAY